LKELRNDPEIAPYLKDVPAQILQQGLWDALDAYDRFFKGQNKYPRYHQRSGKQSFRIPQYVQVHRVSKRWGEVRIPKLGWVRFRYHRVTIGKIKAATIIKNPDGTWFVSLRCQQRDHYPAQKRLTPESVIGVDLGCINPVAISNGSKSQFYQFQSWKPKEIERLRRLEQQRERQVKGSHNQAKTKQKIAIMHARPKRRRKDFAEQVSHELTRDHAGVVIEDMIITNLTASAKGTVEEPGTNVAQKSGLNRSVLDQGWGQTRTRIEEKAQRRGTLVVRERTAYSSRECSACGYTHADNRPGKPQALFQCQACGYTDHADVNAPKTLRKRSLVKGRFGDHLIPTPEEATTRITNLPDKTLLSTGELDLAGGTPVTARQGRQALDANEQHDPSSGQRDQ
jgi:putative transposase